VRRPHRKPKHAVGRDAEITKLWRAWLGPSGTRPPPLDRFMSGQLRDALAPRAPLAAALRALTRWAPTAWVLAERISPDLIPTSSAALCEALRQSDPGELIRITRVLDGGRGASADRIVALRQRWASSDDPQLRALAVGIPPGWAAMLAPRLARWSRPEADTWLDLQRTAPPLWLRAQRADAAQLLRDDGFGVELVDGALRATGTRAIRGSRAWKEGAVEVQDLASQRIGRAVPAAPGQVLWDVCAGAGGKTLQLAEALRGRGAVHATDTDPSKLAALRQRVKRAGLSDVVRVHHWDGETLPSWGPEVSKRGGFDAVLVDAPCSATGTWRRNPDARIRTEPGSGGWAPLQHRLLELASDAVRPSGTLAYATCSVLVEEDEDVVADVVERHPRLRPAERRLTGAPDRDADTMFLATWVRDPA
jgi:16S rRNA (cytosine967-C5)-methyltransferase